MSLQKKLAFVLFHDPVIGPSFEARLIETLSDGSFSLSYIRLSKQSMAEHGYHASETELQLIRICRELSHSALVQSLSKSEGELNELIRSKGERWAKQILRPYVERRITGFLALCKEKNIPVFLMEADWRMSEVPLIFEDDEPEVKYHFDYQPEAFSYSLQLSVAGQSINLRDASFLLLSDQPAWFLYRHRLYHLTAMNGNKLKPFIDKPRVLIPPQTEKKYFETFVSTLLTQTSVSQSGFQIKEKPGKPLMVLTMGLDFQGEPILMVKYRYAEHLIHCDHSNPRLVTMNGERHPPSFEVIIRDLKHEHELLNRMLQLGLKRKSDNALVLADGHKDLQNPFFDLVDFVTEQQGEWQQIGIELIQENSQIFSLNIPEVSTRVSDENDWFDIAIDIRVGEHTISFINLRDHILEGRRDYLLPDGTIFLIPNEWFSRFRGVTLFGKTGSGGFRLKKNQLALVQDYLDSFSKTESGGVLQRIFSGQQELLAQVKQSLRTYQTLGVQWMLGLNQERFGGCLADDMGLGKTIQVLALLQHFKTKNNWPVLDRPPKVLKQQATLFDEPGEAEATVVKTTLVVMPVSLLHNWENEIRKFTPELSWYLLSGQQRNSDPDWLRRFDLVLTSYGTLRNDIAVLEKMVFHYLILDESQHAKNADSQTFQALGRIHAVNRLIMTGTPIENSLDDLWSQMTLINPGLLGSRSWFRDHFIRSHGAADVNNNKALLRDLVRPYIMRRTKEAVAPELPPLTQEIRLCEPSEQQWSFYEARKSEVRNMLINRFKEPIDGTARMLVLQSLMKLRLIASHPVMADAAYTADSGKLNEMMSMIEELRAENHQILIFSQFVKHLKIMGAAIEKTGIDPLYLTGQDSPKQRQKAIKIFQKGDSHPIFLVSLKAGGVGLNLTRAAYVFLADPWWNPAVENQAISRAHRIGQENQVFAYRFITAGTIEEKILHLQERKRELADLFVNRNALDLINPEQILSLLE